MAWAGQDNCSLLGRFTQVDPFPGVLSLPQGRQAYAYGANNPARYVDPTGRQIEWGVMAWAWYEGFVFGYKTEEARQRAALEDAGYRPLPNPAYWGNPGIVNNPRLGPVGMQPAYVYDPKLMDYGAIWTAGIDTGNAAVSAHLSALLLQDCAGSGLKALGMWLSRLSWLGSFGVRLSSWSWLSGLWVQGQWPPLAGYGTQATLPPGEDKLARLPPFTGGKTTGILEIPGADDVRRTSGWSGPASAYRGQAVPGMNIVTKSHVEGHAAAVMRQLGVAEATLYLNNPPCGGATGCANMLSRMLPEGATLTVIAPNGYRQVFTGVAP